MMVCCGGKSLVGNQPWPFARYFAGVVQIRARMVACPAFNVSLNPFLEMDDYSSQDDRSSYFPGINMTAVTQEALIERLSAVVGADKVRVC